MKLFAFVFLVLFGCVLYTTGQRVSLTSVGDGTPLGGGEWDFTSQNQDQDCEQACPIWYTRKDGRLNGYFKFEVFQIIELNSTGGACCGTCPPVAQTCNRRLIYQLLNAFNTSIVTPDKQVIYAGNMGNNPLSETQCAGANAITSPICALLTVNYQVFDTAGTVNIGNQSFAVRKDSAFCKLKINNWSYFTGSQGLRVVLLLTVGDTNTNKFVMNPGELENPAPITGFQTATIVDSQGREAAIAFVNYALYDGIPLAQNVTVSGPYPALGDINGRYFYIDIPRQQQSNGVEVYYNLYLPELTGGSDVVSSTQFVTPFLGLIFFVIMMLL